MKNSIIVFISLLVMFYLIGCFIEVSFNIAEWTEGVRLGIAVLGTFMSAVLTGAFAEARNS
jgi:multisubunit Na+/H+ antiporter MnhE subunit